MTNTQPKNTLKFTTTHETLHPYSKQTLHHCSLEKVANGFDKNGRPKFSSKHVKEEQEVDLSQNLESALDFGGIENQAHFLKKAILDFALLDKKDAILAILNRQFEDDLFGRERGRGSIQSKSGEYIYGWEYEIKE